MYAPSKSTNMTTIGHLRLTLAAVCAGLLALLLGLPSPSALAASLTQKTFGPYAGWTASAISVGTDNTTHVLWNKTDGTVSLWNLNTADGTFTSLPYGPYAGWSARAVADGPDGRQRLLWSKSDGTVSVWSVDQTSGKLTQRNFGPYAGWKATALSVGLDNITHVLWTSSKGQASLWNLNTADGTFTDMEFGPYAGLSANAISDGPDGMMRVLWANPNGSATFWGLDPNSGVLAPNSYGPYSGWAAVSASVGQDNTNHLLWTADSGQAALWNANPATGAFTSVQYGPYVGWSARAVADGPDGQQRLLWTKTDGTVSVWSVNQAPPLPTVTSVTAAPNPVAGGSASVGMVTLSAPATAGGITVALSSDSAAAKVPAGVTVPVGATGATFSISTTNPAFAGGATAHISGVTNGVKQTATLTISRVGPITGVYRLTTRGQQSMALDVSGFGNGNGATVQLYAAGHTCNQQWLVEDMKDGTYKIHAYSGVNSNQVLDLTNGAITKGTLVKTYQDNGNTAQRWIFLDIGGGFYRIIPKNAGAASAQTLDLSGGDNAASGSTTAIFPYYGGPNQVFRLDPPGPPQPTPGVYRLATRGHPELALDVYGFGNGNSTNIQLWTANHSSNQQWLVQTNGGNIYSIAAYSGINSLQMLDDAGGATGNGTNVTTYEDTGSNNQRWLFQDIGGGYSRIVPVNAAGTAQTLDVRNGNSAKAGDTLNIYGYYGGDNQVFQLLDPGASQILPSPKKGMGSKEWAGWSIHNSWYYTWGSSEPTDAPPGTEFVPMEWGYYGGDNSDWLRSTIAQPGVKNMLAFNEPDHTDQANIDVPYALTGYQYLSNVCGAAKIPLGSPAASDDNNQWFADFMAGATSRGYHVDFIAVHCYIRDPNAFKSYITNLHNRYWQYPLWITEFAPADWSGTNPVSDAEAAAFMRQVVPWLNSQWYVSRYAWYTGSDYGTGTLGSAALLNGGAITPLGQLYSRM